MRKKITIFLCLLMCAAIFAVAVPVNVGATGSWQYTASMTYKRDKLGAATGLDGTIYAMGGMPDAYKSYDVLEAYDPDSDTWTTKAPMPIARNSFATATDGDGNIYAIGGFTNTLTNRVDAYDPATDTWSTKSPMSKARDFSGAAEVDGKIYVFGGGRTIYNGKLVEMYDPATNSWTIKTPMPTSRYAMGVIAVDGLIYVIGGGLVWSSTAITTVEVYNPATDTWDTTKSSMPGPRYRFGAALGTDGKIYVIGGSPGGGSITSSVYAYDIATDTWSGAPSLPSQRWDHAGVTGPNGKIYAIGGYSYYPYGRTTTVLALQLNSEPDIVNIVGPDPVPINIGMSISADFTDPDVGDTHTATWYWGDLTSSPGIVDEVEKTVTGTHKYTETGVYTVTLELEDKAGASDSMDYQYVVVFDPYGGFVTGGGWIDSPPGAHVVNPDDPGGKANFGFVAKYKKGASEPMGNTQFEFDVGHLEFHSDSYDWLVIGGTSAIFKGSGTINEEGEYKFKLWAVDGEIPEGGEVDKFRIKIWEEDEFGVETVIYDNKEETELGGGQIMIHKG